MSFISQPASPITSIPVTVPQGGTGQTSLTANNVLLGNGTSALQVVAPGASGNVLQSNGTTWTSAAASTGAMTLIQTQTASGASTLDFTGITGYNQYRFVIGSWLPSTPGSLEMLYSYSGTFASSSVYITSDIYLDSVALQRTYNNTFNRSYFSTSAAATTSQYGASGYVDFFNASTSGKYVVSIANMGYYFNTGPAWTFQQRWVVCTQATTGFDGVRFQVGAGTFSGKFSLYGITQ